MPPMQVGEFAVVDSSGLEHLIALLGDLGFNTLGPVQRDGAIVPGPVSAAADLPVGWHDVQAPGSYRVHQSGDGEFFGWAVGPQSWKSTFFPAHETLWRTRPAADGVEFVEQADPAPVAIVGARPCELAGLSVLDAVLSAGAHPDAAYAARRAGAFVVAAECGSPSASCFCPSMETGPHATTGFDLSLTELSPEAAAPAGAPRSGGIGDETPGAVVPGISVPSSTGHRFLVRVGSVRGGELLDAIEHRPCAPEDLAARDAVLARSVAQMGRALDTDGLPELLGRNLEHPRWQEVADRCLSCGNCTMVCPTCFCSDVDDVTDLTGSVERRRHWASCFDLDHSYLHGGSVRKSPSSRYRQWATHKLSTWHDQFGMSGCVGCGRCVTWCPVGIDITEEAAAIRASDGQKEAPPSSGGEPS